MAEVAMRVALACRFMSAGVALFGLMSVLGLSPRVALAEEDRPKEPAPSALEEIPTPSATAAAIDRAHEIFSTRITDIADRIDAFFGDERYLEETNQSYLSLGVVRLSDETGVKITGQIKLKIVLPRLQRRLHVVIEGEDDISGTLGLDGGDGGLGGLASAPPQAQPSDLVSALRLVVRSTRDINIYVDGGIRIRTDPSLFARIRYRTSHDGAVWAVRFTQGVKWEEAFAENPYHWEVISQLDFERLVASDFFFRSSLQGAWYEGRHGYFVTQAFSLVQRLAKQRALVYQWIIGAQTGQILKDENNVGVIVDPDQRFRIGETSLMIRYRQTIWRPWLFFEAGPELAFRRDLDPDPHFDGVWRSLVKLEVQFRDLGTARGILPH